MPEPQMPFHMARNSVSADQLMTMAEIADTLGVKYWTVRAWACGAEKTKIPFPAPLTKIGRRPMWTRKSIIDWHNARK